MVYKLHKNGSYNIHTIKTDKFKTIRMEIVFRNNIDPKTIEKRTCVFDLLMENSKKYKTKRDLILRLEELYNATCYTVSSRVGNEIISSVCMEFLNPKYTKENFLSSAIELPFELIFNPNIKDNEFNETTLETIKLRTIAEIKTINEDKKRKSIYTALKHMDDSSISSVNILGSEEKLKAITPGNLYQEYQKILNHDYVDIFIIGDFNEDKVINLINKYASFKTIKNHDLNLFINNKIRRKEQIIKEKEKNQQSYIVCIYNTFNLTEEERKYAMQIYNMILGGGSLETKLYQNLRDKNSLCYNVSSIYNKYDNLLIIETSVDKKNVDISLKLIQDSIKDMKNITEEELKIAVSSVISSINLSLDQPSRIIDNYLFNYMAELDSIDDRIDKYNKLTVSEVLKVIKKIKLNTIYVLEGDL